MESTSLVKGITLLETLASAGGHMALAQLSEQSGLPKPTAHRVLATLVALGYVEHRVGGSYKLTPRLGMVARGFGNSKLVDAAEPLIQELYRSTGETVNLGALRQDMVVYLRVLESKQPLRRVLSDDACDPFYCTALGRSIVAFLPAPQRDMLLQNAVLQPRTEKTLVDARELRRVLEQVRIDGYAIEEDQTDLGVTCIGAPVFRNEQVVAAISVSVPTVRGSGARRTALIQAVREATAELSDKLNDKAGVGV